MATEKSLQQLARVTEAYLTAMEHFKQTGNGEKKAEDAFNEFHLALDPRTVEQLIDGLQSAQRLADAFMWLTERCVSTARGVDLTGAGAIPTGLQTSTLEFKWTSRTDDPKTLGQAVLEAMANKSPIILPH